MLLYLIKLHQNAQVTSLSVDVTLFAADTTFPQTGPCAAVRQKHKGRVHTIALFTFEDEESFQTTGSPGGQLDNDKFAVLKLLIVSVSQTKFDAFGGL